MLFRFAIAIDVEMRIDWRHLADGKGEDYEVEAGVDRSDAAIRTLRGRDGEDVIGIRRIISVRRNCAGIRTSNWSEIRLRAVVSPKATGQAPDQKQRGA